MAEDRRWFGEGFPLVLAFVLGRRVVSFVDRLYFPEEPDEQLRPTCLCSSLHSAPRRLLGRRMQWRVSGGPCAFQESEGCEL